MAELRITRTTPVYRNPSETGVFVQWDIPVLPSVDIVKFKVERSGSPEGPFETILDNVFDYHFFDRFRHLPVGVSGVRENLNFLSLSRGISYRVTAVCSDDTEFGETREAGPTLENPKIYLLRRKMQRDLAVSLKFNGVDVAVLKRMHWGTRCTACFDALTKKVTRSKCWTCFGTGFVGGYFTPIRIKGRFGVQNVQTDVTQQDMADINKKRLTMLTYPEIENGDVVVDVRQNKRYIVQNRHLTELQTVGVHQVLTLSELARDAAEYRVVANLDNIATIY